LGLTAALVAAAAIATAPAAAVAAPPAAWNRPPARLDAGVAVSWFDLLYDLIRDARLSPPVASRTIGYAGVTLYEAVVPGMPFHRSLAGQLNELVEMPEVARGQAHHWPTVANAALSSILRSLSAGAPADLRARIDALEAEVGAGFAGAAPQRTLEKSVGRGRAVAEAVAEWAAGDGYAELNDCPYTPPSGEGLWEPTLPAFAPALQPCWGRMRPFVLADGSSCAPPPPPAFSTEPGSAFYAEGLEVYESGTSLTPEQEAIARFWADNPGQTGTPPGHWIAIVGQIAAADRLSLATAAEAYARVGLAVADAFISCWNTKYAHNLLRPITYVQEVFDAAWQPLLSTPPFPEYTSGHSVQSGAAATVLTDLLGARPFTDDTHAGLFPARSFDSFEEAATEAAISRLYGGIHFRSAIAVGVEQGECVGGTILRRVQFRRFPRR
jgi:hypothetical protein